MYEILCYPDALWTCLAVTNKLILYVLFHSHYTSNCSLYILFDNWFNFIQNMYKHLFMKERGLLLGANPKKIFFNPKSDTKKNFNTRNPTRTQKN